MDASDPLEDDDTAMLVSRLQDAAFEVDASPAEMTAALSYLLADIAVRFRFTSREVAGRVVEQHRAVRLAARARH